MEVVFRGVASATLGAPVNACDDADLDLMVAHVDRAGGAVPGLVA